jgi:2-oxoglutarate ferredoxin oxidoreductase subunit alpha
MDPLGITIAGEAGQGLQLVSDLTGRLLARAGLQVFVLQDVMSRIRGGHNFARLRCGAGPVSAPADSDVLQVCLRPGFVAQHLSRLGAVGLALCEEGEGAPQDPRVVSLPIARTAVEAGGGAKMANSVALGLVAATLDLPVDGFAESLRERFGAKDGNLARRNVDSLAAGIALGRESGLAGRLKLPAPAGRRPLVLLTGSHALALGAIAGNVRVVAGYPMSPGTPVLEYCSRHAQTAGLVVEFVEDEVAAINLALGASFAGARAMVATSGGGFALMNEGLSLSGMTETPVVVMLGMRPGPATGMATRTAQADLLSAIHAGHGEFPRVVLAPGDARAAYDCALRATDLADRFQVPTIVLFDQLLGDGAWTVDDLPPPAGAGRGADGAEEPYTHRRYAAGQDGVSPRIRPGTRNQLVYVDSDEHGEEGHITESAEVRTAMVQKRAAKFAALLREAPAPAVWPEPAGLLACCFGSTKGTVAEAVTRLRAGGTDVAMVHFDWLWPFPAEPVQRLCGGRRVVTVENNYGGQLAQLLAQEALVECRGTVRRFDGRPFTVAEVVDGIAGLGEKR